MTDNRPNRNRIPVSKFQPRTREERVIYEIAQALNEPYIDFIKSIKDRFGFDLIWDAWQEYKEVMKRGAPIEHPRGFFNYLIKIRRPDRK